MKPVRTIGLFAVALAAVFGGGAAVGKAVGPVDAPAAPAHGSDHRTGEDAGHASASHADPVDPAAAEPPGGLMVSASGYTLRLASEELSADRRATLSFTVVGPDGEPVQEYTPAHEKELHLIVVRRDLTGYQHLHPVRDEAGRWSSTADLSVPGAYRVLADFTPAGGAPLTLGADLAVPGDFEPTATPEPVEVATVGGYEVRLSGRPAADQEAPLSFTLLHRGRPVTDLEPYLGAYGHLVALRAGDLAYLHVHPAGHPGDGVTTAGPSVGFVAEVPSPGTYRLFLDFKHDGTVRTAPFTVRVDASGSSAAPSEGDGHDAPAHAH